MVQVIGDVRFSSPQHWWLQNQAYLFVYLFIRDNAVRHSKHTEQALRNEYIAFS